ncbi:Clavaminate synthase-like protein [Hypoxylon sp. NC1633]|nr:Clavaminate synthase-like protein [Hypoxylon sp. NC1633]
MLSSLRFSSRLASHGPLLRWSGCQVRPQSTSSAISNYDTLSDETKGPINRQHIPHVETVAGEVDLNSFRKVAWIPETPLLLSGFDGLPATRKWFQYGNSKSNSNSCTGFARYMKTFENTILPYEFTIPRVSRPGEPGSGYQVLSEFLVWLRDSNEYRESYLPLTIEAMIQSIDRQTHEYALDFQQFDGPLSLIISACQFNETKDRSSERIKRLYVAQSDLRHLPQPLSEDLPVPSIVKHAGKGDIYSSSIWLGLEPTYTPLHRDPNPNLFCQLVGSKQIRLMTPNQGDDVYSRVRRELGSDGNSRFRGAEMMRGRERELLHHAVWGDRAANEVCLEPGNALFIPKGWWHSVASCGNEGKLNASANWWFR